MTLSSSRVSDFNSWYLDVIQAADLAENSPVRGCMVIKPWGYAIWELIQRELDQRIKETGHDNAYFPLLIPKNFIEKEAQHIDGFAKECAVVTHHRLESDSSGKLEPAGELTEPYIIRPTSETIIGLCFAKWIQSYRDLPLKINQWANVMRWEMRPRLLLRTSEFLWQEGHTAHATRQEAEEEAQLMHQVYKDFLKNFLALPCFEGQKTPDEKFPGAEITYTLEVMSQNGKAIQAGTSHFLGQTFAKSFEIGFSSAAGTEELAWTTSWGVSTRLLGALVMVHSDDDGLVLPPSISPVQVWINLIVDKGDVEAVRAFASQIQIMFQQQAPLCRVKINPQEYLSPGESYWKAVRKGIPIVLEIGPRDVRSQTVVAYCRHEQRKKKHHLTISDLVQRCVQILSEQQRFYYEQAESRLLTKTKFVTTQDELTDCFQDDFSCFAKSFWHPRAIGHPLLERLQITPRCLLENRDQGICLLTGEPTNQLVIFAKSY